MCVCSGGGKGGKGDSLSLIWSVWLKCVVCDGVRGASSFVLGTVSVSFAESSDDAYSVTDGTDRELREVTDRCPDSSRTRKWETEVFGGDNGGSGGEDDVSPLIRMEGVGGVMPLMICSTFLSALIR